LPDKLQIAKNYVKKISLKIDLSILIDTIKIVMGVFNTKNK
jgi:lipopolysaccharide/colanic/teichoic acid biosynthesis glycosyltransferase